MMEKPEKAGSANALWVERLAEARGLGRALALFPETITAAIARASASLSPLPGDFSSTTEPAHIFGPAGCADGDSIGTSFDATVLGGRK
jgi:hypothetical protein